MGCTSFQELQRMPVQYNHIKKIVLVNTQLIDEYWKAFEMNINLEEEELCLK
jgi:hypothetical protein